MNARITLLVLVLTLWIDNSVGICCGSGRCEDGTNSGPFRCCGVGACNMFCCDCDDGCIKAKEQGPRTRTRRPLNTYKNVLRNVKDFRSDLKYFASIDKNGDGKIDFSEAGIHLDGLTSDMFNVTDKNGDGQISYKEFDKDLAVDVC